MRVNFSAPLVDIEPRVQTPFAPADAGAQALRQNWVPAGACHRAGQRPGPLAGTNGDGATLNNKVWAPRFGTRRNMRLPATAVATEWFGRRRTVLACESRGA